jgi:GT2 family glycosyltransferase
MKTVSVVVITHNRPKSVKDTLASLITQKVPPYEIILIDNGLTPPLKVDLPFPNLNLIRLDSQEGLSYARNLAITVAKGDYIAFVDDDAIVDQNWLLELQKNFEFDLLGGSIKPLYESKPPAWWSEKDFGGCAGIGNIQSSDPADCIWGTNIIISKAIFKAVGVFNENIGRQKGKLLSGEETELISRALKKRFKVTFVPDAIVYHKVSMKKMTFSYVVRWNYFSGRSQKAMGRINLPRDFAYLLFCLFALADPRNLVASSRVKIQKITRLSCQLGKLS